MSDTASAAIAMHDDDDRARRHAFWISAAVVSHTMWTSAAPALSYRLYAERWHLSAAMTNGIFAVYPVVVVVVLLLFGKLSDIVGRRAAMMLGVAFSLAGVALFAAASGVGALLVGRCLMGVGVGLSAGPATAALAEHGSGTDGKVSGATAVMAQSVGMTAAFVVSGALIEYAPIPMRLGFGVLAALLAILLLAIRRLPRPSLAIDWTRWRPSSPVVASDARRPFVAATASLTTAYTHGALLLSLGGHIVHDLIGAPNALVAGLLLALFPISLGGAGVLARGVPARALAMRGAFCSFAGMALLALAIACRSMALMLVASAVSGAGYSFQVSGGLSTLASAGMPRHREGLVSAALLVAYLAMGSAALLLGFAATRWGLGIAADIAAAVIATLCALTWAIVRSQAHDDGSARMPCQRQVSTRSIRSSIFDRNFRSSGDSLSER